jgi:hypothetical protein
MANKKVNYELRAEDSFTGTFDKLKGQITDTEAHFARMKGLVAGMFAGFSLAGLTELVKSIVETGDEAYKMAQKVGVGVEAWQQLVYVGKLADVAQDTLAKGLKGLSQNLFEAFDGGEKAVGMFARLGIQVKDASGALRPTAQVLLDVAETFRYMRDGAEKTAIATQLFGKAGMELIPMLNQGRDAMEATMKEAERLGLVMDKRTAAAAEALNDNFTRLGAATRGMLIQGVAPLIPFMEKMSDSMVRARTEGEGLATGSKILETGLKLVGSVAIVVKGTFEALGQLIGGIAAAWIQWVSMKPGETLKVLKQTFSDVAAISDRNKGLIKELWDGTASGADKAAVATVGFTAKTKEAVQANNELNDVLSKLLGLEAGFQPDFSKEMVIITEAMLRGKISLELFSAALTALMNKQPVVERFFKMTSEQLDHLNKLRREALDLQVEEINDRNRVIDSLQDTSDRLDIELRTLGGLNAEREVQLLLLEKERAIKFALDDEDELRINRMYDEIAAKIRLREQLQLQLSVWNDIGERVGRFFGDLVTDGRDAFRKLSESLKSFAAEIAALFAKRWIMQIAAGVTGSSALGAAAGNVGQGTATNAAGSLIGSGMDYGATALGYTAFGGIADASAGWTAGSAFAVGAAESAPVYGTLMGEIGGALGSIPVYGWIALAVVAIAAWFSGQGGGARWAGPSWAASAKMEISWATWPCPVRTTIGSTRRARAIPKSSSS